MPSRGVSDRGFDICGVRDFEASDSFRSLSRRHFVRTGEEVVIEKHPERNALMLFMFDISASEHVGADRMKYEASVELLRHLGNACLFKGNIIQVLAFGTTIQMESRIISNANALEEVIDILEDFKSGSYGTDYRDIIERIFSFVQRPYSPADLVCIISDFLFPEPREPFLRELDHLHEAVDIIAIVVRDFIEVDMPPIRGALRIRDAETGETFWAGSLSGSDPVKELGRYNIDTCELMTSQSEEEWFAILSDFLTARMESDIK
jgi:uncharacterized protein (DUF58 family)